MTKWKRKAKLAMTPSRYNAALGTPGKPKFFLSTSSHNTEDESDASYRTMFLPPRRPSSAMADLSVLMEQSLHSLRKETVAQPSPSHRPSQRKREYLLNEL